MFVMRNFQMLLKQGHFKLNSHLFWLNSHPFFVRPIYMQIRFEWSVVNQGTTRELAGRSN
jgi:hypothetical protein